MRKVLAVLTLLVMVGFGFTLIGQSHHRNDIRNFGFVLSLIGGLAFGRLLYLNERDK